MGSFSVMPGVRNKNQTPLYDTKTVAAAGATGTSIEFFANTESASGIQVTNLRRANQLEQGEKFTCFGIAFSVVNPDRADLTELYKNYAAVLQVSGGDRIKAPIEHFPSGGGVHAGAAATTVAATTIFSATNGAPGMNAVNMLAPEYAIEIEGGQLFNVRLLGASFTATAAIFLRCYLLGVLETLVK